MSNVAYVGVIDVVTVENGDRTIFFFSSRRRHTRLQGDWSSDVCSSDLLGHEEIVVQGDTPITQEGRERVVVSDFFMSEFEWRIEHEEGASAIFHILLNRIDRKSVV